MVSQSRNYSFFDPAAPDTQRYWEIRVLKRSLGEAGFRWCESTAHRDLEIHDGGDILCGNRYRVGTLTSGGIITTNYSRLEQFLEEEFGLIPN